MGRDGYLAPVLSVRRMSAAGRRPLAVRFLVAILAGMWLTAFHPLPGSNGRSDGCDRGGATATHQIVLEPAQMDCHESSLACLAAAECITVATALSPSRLTLSSVLIARRAGERGVTSIVDLFQAGPPTPPPNS